MVSKIFDPTIGALNTSLNLRQVNHNVISSNIANQDTPGYKAKEVEFESAFREALGADSRTDLVRTDDRHIAPSPSTPVYPEIYEVPNDVYSLDGNTVNAAEEQEKLAENSMMYETSIELLKKKLGMLKYAISEGGGGR